MDDQNIKWLRWQILGLEILELATSLMKFTACTLILGALGVALKDEVLTLMISSELSLNGEVVTVEVLNSHMNGIILLIALIYGCSSFVTLICNNQRISDQAKNSAIGCLSLMMVGYTIDIPFFLISASILIWVSLKSSYTVFRKLLWMRELGHFFQAKSLSDLPNFESISVMDNQHGILRDYIAYFSNFLPEHHFVILESVRHIVEDELPLTEGGIDDSGRKVYVQKMEVVYRFKNSGQYFTNLFTLPERLVNDSMIQPEGGITS